MSDTLRTEIQNPDLNNPAEWPLTPLKCELASPITDWPRTWRLVSVRQQGMDPDLTLFALSLLWGILLTRARLNRMLPLTNPSPTCVICAPERVTETLQHTLSPCVANQGLPSRLLRLLQIYQPGGEQQELLTLDLGINPSLELPMTWAICSLLFSLWRQRDEGRVSVAKTRSELEAKCRLLRKGKMSSLTNAYLLTNNILCELYSSQL